ncbi:MAG: hypothetical protein K2P51_02435 [Rhabdochlamydiaceae bacterium]|nr:hypothetical protein [Rhabdochlamydiaceae bacterium]
MSASASLPTDRTVLLYAGPGAWDVSVEETQNMLSRYFDTHSIKRAYDLSNLNEKTALLVIPGGSLLEIHDTLARDAKKISDYIQNGGRYLGICAGAIYMSECMIGKPAYIPPSASEEIRSLFKQNLLTFKFKPYMKICSLGLYPGPCIAPHIVKTIDRESPLNFCAAQVHLPSLEEAPFNLYTYSGPVFQKTPPGTKVLLHFADPLEYQVIEENCKMTNDIIAEKSPAACISYMQKKGKIVLSGVHPEINPSTFAATALKYQFRAILPEEIKESESARIKLLDTLFKELDFHPISTSE